jgi:hypothetical protein
MTTMLTRTIAALAIALASIPAFGSSDAFAGGHHTRRHHHHAYAVPDVPPAPYSGPTLVLHPAANIACDTPYRATRALPCDQPAWVYGRPCEIDMGLGRSRSCD